MYPNDPQQKQALNTSYPSTINVPCVADGGIAPTAPPGVSSSLGSTMSLAENLLERVGQLRGALMQEPPSQTGQVKERRSGMAGTLDDINDKLRMAHSHLDMLERYLNS